MPRRPRLTVPGAVYHVMARGNRRSTIFHDNQQRTQMLELLDTAVTRYALRILVYCLMGTHYHFILETPRGNLSEAMQYINGRFAQRSNRRFQQSGHVFEGRFRSLIIQRQSYLERAARYVVRNPLRAGLVTAAGEWPWSSYRATAGLESVPPWLAVDWMLRVFKTESMTDARRRYVEYVNAPTARKQKIDLNATVLGGPRFTRQVLDSWRAVEQDRPVPPLVRPPVRPPLRTLLGGATDSGICRDGLIYSAHVNHGYGLSEIARFLGIDRSTASKAATRHERAAAGV